MERALFLGVFACPPSLSIPLMDKKIWMSFLIFKVFVFSFFFYSKFLLWGEEQVRTSLFSILLILRNFINNNLLSSFIIFSSNFTKNVLYYIPSILFLSIYSFVCLFYLSIHLTFLSFFIIFLLLYFMYSYILYYIQIIF